MDDVCNHWRKLSITAEEEEEIGIGDSLVEEGKSLFRKGLIGKLITKRPYNINSFKSTIPKLWRVTGNLEIIDVAQDMFFFIFDNHNEIERILNLEPWTFNRSLLVLQEFEGLNFRDVDVPRHTRFWIQVHNLPDYGMTEKIGRIIGDGLGISLEVDSDSEGRCLGSFLRVRTLIDVSKPLRRGAPIRLGSDSNKIWLDFKYERVPDFCYVCGIIGHGHSECSLPSANSCVQSGIFPYGNFLKGDPPFHRRNPPSHPNSSNLSPITVGHSDSPSRVGPSTNTRTRVVGEGGLHLPNPNISDSNSSESVDSFVGVSPNLAASHNSPVNRAIMLSESQKKSPQPKTVDSSTPMHGSKGNTTISMSPSKILFKFGVSSTQRNRSLRNWKLAARSMGNSKQGASSSKSLTPVKRKFNFPTENLSGSPKRMEVNFPNSDNALSAEVATQPRRAQ
ncbi:hypothetical protein DH2020_046455 [Rehmannia glutinosa]|uniref:CCHC-type domain-containing protein n=1 Tax=Rehmannia glutinosa TaxID=99300 RepID=A0ABR0UCA6_REHGL